MTNVEMLIALMQSNAMGERGKSRGSKTKRDTRIHMERSEVWDEAADYVQQYLVPKPVEIPVVLNENVTAENYLAVAEKFNEARWGNGPGVGKHVLAEIGLGRPDSFKSRTAGHKLSLDDENSGWEYLCCYVWECLSDDDFPASKSRGRGFRSQGNGQVVMDLLKKLASPSPQKEAV